LGGALVWNSNAPAAGPSGTIIMLDGVYTNNVILATRSNFTLRAQNTWGARMSNATLQVYGGYSNTIDGLFFTNKIASSSVISNAESFCTIKNCRIGKAVGYGISLPLNTSSNNVVDSCLVEAVTGDGVMVSGQNNVVRNNVIRHCTGWGLQLYSPNAIGKLHNNQVYNNLMYDTGKGDVAYPGDILAGGESGAVVGTNYVFCNTLLDGITLWTSGTMCTTNNIVFPVTTNTPLRTNINTFFRAGTNAGPSMVGGGNIVVDRNTIGFAGTNEGRYWLTATSLAVGAAKENNFGPVDFFSRTPTRTNDVGAFQYSPTLEADWRDLETNPQYWNPTPTTSSDTFVFDFRDYVPFPLYSLRIGLYTNVTTDAFALLSIDDSFGVELEEYGSVVTYHSFTNQVWVISGVSADIALYATIFPHASTDTFSPLSPGVYDVLGGTADSWISFVRRGSKSFNVQGLRITEVK
jgi:hypothetical protein